MQYILEMRKRLRVERGIDVQVVTPRAQPVSSLSPPNVKIYVLCHNEQRLAMARTQYAQFYWAFPILMKYQDTTFENAFWKQLLEIKSEWEDCEMVGTISAIAHMKINIDMINNIIVNRKYNVYYNFTEKPKLVNMNAHPHMLETWSRVMRELQLEHPTTAYCNYWMASPHLMELFIQWFHEKLLPCVQACPHIYSDARYKGSLSSVECVQKFGTPFYPLMPFFLERVNICFFKKYFKENPDAYIRA
jgi:hypothetical protein